MKTKFSISIFALVGAFLAHGQTLNVSPYTISGGGGTSSGAQLSISGSIGLYDAGAPMTNGTFAVSGGFWSSVAAGTGTSNSKSTPMITWANPAAIIYGRALSSIQLNAAANVPGAFTYTPSTATVLNAGTNTLSVLFTPTDTANYNAASATVTQVVSRAAITVTANNATRFYGQSTPAFTGTIAGVTNNDNVTVTFNSSASLSSPPGSYPIVPSLFDPNGRLPNYTVTTNLGTLVIIAACVAPPTGIAGWWRAEGDALDTGGANNGTLVNGAGFAPGLVGQAFSLNGINQRVDIADSATLAISGPITIEAWIKRSATGAQHSIVEKYNFTVGGFGLRVGSNDKVVFFTTDPSFQSDGLSGSTPLGAGTWYHVAGLWDGANLKIYVNGVLDGTISSLRNPKTGNTPLRIGARGDDAGTVFAGLIDEVDIFNRALSASEIAAIYNAGNLGKCLVPPPLTIIRSLTNVILTWPTNTVGFTLQSATNLVSPAVWSTNSVGPTVVNGQNAVTNHFSGQQKFYRLSQ